jgi:hypothetical protein
MPLAVGSLRPEPDLVRKTARRDSELPEVWAVCASFEQQPGHQAGAGPWAVKAGAQERAPVDMVRGPEFAPTLADGMEDFGCCLPC